VEGIDDAEDDFENDLDLDADVEDAAMDELPASGLLSSANKATDFDEELAEFETAFD
jgi:hypothetical protein